MKLKHFYKQAALFIGLRITWFFIEPLLASHIPPELIGSLFA